MSTKQEDICGGEQMKYGEILDFRTKDKAVIGKNYVFANNLFKICNSPETCFDGSLLGVLKENSFPFVMKYCDGFQFVREIIEEESKYRPYKDTAELKADFFKEYRLDVSKRHRPSIWVVSKSGNEFQIEMFFNKDKAVYVNNNVYTMSELFRDFTYLDGSPCGIKEK